MNWHIFWAKEFNEVYLTFKLIPTGRFLSAYAYVDPIARQSLGIVRKGKYWVIKSPPSSCKRKLVQTLLLFFSFLHFVKVK